MKTRPVLVLLSSVLLLCSAAPDLEPVTCNEDGGAPAARLAMHDINEHHRHGYKFKLSNISGTIMEPGDEGCTMQLQLNLAETDCPHISPKSFEDCDVPSTGERAVVANCSVLITVKSGNATVDSYECDTRQEMTNQAMVRMCPDCPTLISLKSPEGLASIHEAVQKINLNQSNGNYYILQEVGRILSGYINEHGMYYSTKFIMVETSCRFGSRIAIPACKPLPPAIARRAYCSSFSTESGPPADPTCDYFPPSTDGGDNQDLATPDTDSQSGPPTKAKGRPDHARGPPDQARGPPDQARGPPHHARGPPDQARGPPDHARGPPDQARGPPDQARGPPDHAKGPPDQARGPPPYLIDPCKGALPNSDPALHPICPKPLTERQVVPRSD